MIQVENVMKVIDVIASQVKPETIAWFEELNAPRYEDQSELGEDLFPCANLDDEDIPADIADEISEIYRLAEENDAAYVRFIELPY